MDEVGIGRASASYKQAGESRRIEDSEGKVVRGGRPMEGQCLVFATNLRF